MREKVRERIHFPFPLSISPPMFHLFIIGGVDKGWPVASKRKVEHSIHSLTLMAPNHKKQKKSRNLNGAINMWETWIAVSFFFIFCTGPACISSFSFIIWVIRLVQVTENLKKKGKRLIIFVPSHAPKRIERWACETKIIKETLSCPCLFSSSLTFSLTLNERRRRRKRCGGSSLSATAAYKDNTATF